MSAYCKCDTPVMDIAHDAGCRRCGLPVNFSPPCPGCGRRDVDEPGYPCDHCGSPGTEPDPLILERLEELRAELRAERMSWGELAELQSLARHIPPGDLELQEAAGVPEEYARH